MDDALNPKTRERIDELCRKISVAHTLDDEIQEELRGHIEDKMLAYLDKEEPLTEDDAFLLVERHFGDPANVKRKLQTVHAVEAHISLARRLLAIVVLHVGLLAALDFVKFTLWSVSLWWQLRAENDGVSITSYTAINVVAVILYVVVLWTVLARWNRLFWNRLLSEGEQLWFVRWPIVGMVGLLVAILGLHAVAPNPIDPLNGAPMKPATFFPFIAVSIVVVLVTPILSAFIWLWWCDRPPRRPRTVTYAALVWLALAVLPWQTAKFVHVETGIVESGTHEARGVELLDLFEMPLDNGTITWTLRSGFSMMDPTLSELLISFAISVTLLSAARILYSRYPSISSLIASRWPNPFS